MELVKKLNQNLSDKLTYLKDSGIKPQSVKVAGRLVRMVGMTLEVVGTFAPIGSRCKIMRGNELTPIEAEVVGFAGDLTYLMPTENVKGIIPGSRVHPLHKESGLPVGDALLGRVIDANGAPLDGLGKIVTQKRVPTTVAPMNPLSREPINEPLDVGVRAINSMLTVGNGQRMGLFAGSGVGKSVLMGMMTRGTQADIVVVGLVGERGREVKEFIQDILSEADRAKAVVVAAPADTSPLMRLKGCETAVTVAEYFRDQGKNVLLLMDSLTRYAQAQREIALAVGEPPATKGYPPSVFAKIPKLVERAGNGEEGSGSITAFYTVLTEGDDQQDPVADSARAILDGHIVLSRRLAEQGHYPAIDIEASISRAMPQIVEPDHLQMAMRFKQLYSKYRQNEDLINVGAYVKGSDPDTDFVMENLQSISAYLRQGMNESFTLKESMQQMIMVISAPPTPQTELNQQIRRPVSNGLQK